MWNDKGKDRRGGGGERQREREEGEGLVMGQRGVSDKGDRC